MSTRDRSRAVQAYELVAEEQCGQEAETIAAALRAAAATEGLSPADPWIEHAAAELSRDCERWSGRAASGSAIVRPARAGTEPVDGQPEVTRLRELLERGGPAIVVQPIVELATGRAAGAEALSRFPDLTRRTPEAWFAAAAAAGLGVELELTAIGAALAFLDGLPDGTYLSINASPATITSAALRELLAGVPADRLVIELTEHVEVADYDALAGPLNRLRWSGIRLAVDDAGSGHASLRHILNIAPDIIKLDRALVRDIDTDPNRRSLAASLNMFADRIGACVVAEGIETGREHAALVDLGIPFGQGYFLGRPATRLPGTAGDLQVDRRAWK